MLPPAMVTETFDPLEPRVKVPETDPEPAVTEPLVPRLTLPPEFQERLVGLRLTALNSLTDTLPLARLPEILPPEVSDQGLPEETEPDDSEARLLANVVATDESCDQI